MPRVKAPRKQSRPPVTATETARREAKATMTSYTAGGVFDKKFCERHGITQEDEKRMEAAEVTIITMSRKQLLKTLVVLGILEITVIVLILRLILPPTP